MITLLSPDGTTVEVVEIGTDYEDGQQVSEPMAVVLHGGTHTTVIEGTREAIVALLVEALATVKHWEPSSSHQWKLEDENTLRCKRCNSRISVDYIKDAQWDCEVRDKSDYNGRHVWGRPDGDHSAWSCVRCETYDPATTCTPI